MVIQFASIKQMLLQVSLISKLYQIKMGINTKGPLPPRGNIVYPGVESRHKRKGTWNGSVFVKNCKFAKRGELTLPNRGKKRWSYSRSSNQSFGSSKDLLPSLPNTNSIFERQKKLLNLDVTLYRKFILEIINDSLIRQ